VNGWAEDLLDRLTKPKKQELVVAVKLCLRDVGIRDYVQGMDGWNKVVHAIQKGGLALLPQLTGPELARLNASLVGDGECLYILSELITGSYNKQGVFGLDRRDGGLKLNGHFIDFGWNPESVVVGGLPQVSSA